jgi:hypothetical protein
MHKSIILQHLLKLIKNFIIIPTVLSNHWFSQFMKIQFRSKLPGLPMLLYWGKAIAGIGS